MNALTNLNPDFFRSFAELPNGRKRWVIYSTLADFSISQNSAAEGALIIEGDCDYWIYADTLTILGDIKLPGGNIKISARTINFPQIGTADAPATTSIDISPDPEASPEGYSKERPFDAEKRLPMEFRNKQYESVGGLWITREFEAPQENIFDPRQKWKALYLERFGEFDTSKYRGDDGKDGNSGADAGDIFVFAEMLNGTNVSLNLNATGGQGQDGQGGMTGPIAKDGKNGSGYLYKDLTDKDGRTRVCGKRDEESLFAGIVPAQDLPVSWSQTGGDGGTGGNAGRGGRGGTGGAIECHLPAGTDNNVIAVGGPPGADGEPGQRTPPAKGGEFTLNGVGETFLMQVIYEKICTLNVNDGVPGADGAKVNRAPGEGVGGPGRSTQGSAEVKRRVQYFDSVFFLKLLQKTKLQYLNEPPYDLAKDDRINSEVWRNLDWLHTCLSSLDESAESPAEFARKQEIFHEVSTLWKNYRVGRSIFGKREDWAPQLDVSSYRTELTERVDSFEKIETAFQTAMAQSDAQNAARIELGDAKDLLERKITLLDAQISDLTKDVDPLVAAISEYSNLFNVVRIGILNKLEQYRTEIENHFECDIAKIFKALEMIAFDPKNLVMAGVQGANLLFTGLTEIGGEKKSDVISEIDQLEQDGEPEDPAVTSGQRRMPARLRAMLPKSDEDKAGKLLIVKLKSFEDEHQRALSKLPDGGKDLRTLTAQLKSAIEMKSEVQIAYTLVLSNIQSRMKQKETVRAKIAGIDKELGLQSDPTQVGTVSYLAVLYQNMREGVLELLFDADQALKYMKVSKTGYEGGFEKFRQKSKWVAGQAPTQFTANDLRAAITEIDGELIKQMEKWGTNATNSPQSDMDNSDIRVVIDDPQVLKDFFAVDDEDASDPENIQFLIKTMPGDAMDESEFLVEDTEMKFDMRVNFVRPRLIFEDPDGDHGGDEVEFFILNGGKSVLLPSANGSPLTYQHKPVRKSFTQILHPKEGEVDFKVDASFRGKDPNGNYKAAEPYAMPGLFGEWSFTIDRSVALNKKLNFKNLKAVEIQFGCAFFL